MLFRHATRDISFTLVVDDFGIKYTALSDYNHLKSSLELLYKVTSSPTGTRHLGFDIDYDRPNRVMSLSLDGYIQKLLKSVVPESVKLKLYDSPMIYTPPVFGSTAPQVAPVDSSPLASSSDGRLLQTVVGSLLCYARAIDTLMLTAVCNLSTIQSHPTVSESECAGVFANGQVTVDERTIQSRRGE